MNHLCPSSKGADQKMLSYKTANCPICLEESNVSWGEKNNYTIYQCMHCGHVFADVPLNALEQTDMELYRNVLTHGLMKDDMQYYEHLALGEAKGRHVYNTARRILSESALLSGSNKKWLDVGCGSGHLLAELNKRGWDAVGLEPGGWGQIASEQKGIRVLQEFLTADTFTCVFDVVSATDVLEHQPAPMKFMHLLKHYLKPDGTMFLSIPSADSCAARLLKTRWAMVNPPGHCQFFTARSMNYFLEKLGLKAVKSISYRSDEGSLFVSIKSLRHLPHALYSKLLGKDQLVLVVRHNVSLATDKQGYL